MSIRWIRNVVVDGEESTLEIQLGYKTIGDRCYIRLGNELEEYFAPISFIRSDIVQEGIALLQGKLLNNTVTTPEGHVYDWQ